MKQNTRFLVYWQAFFGVRFNIDITKCCMVSWGYGLKQPHRYGRRSEEEQRQFKVEAGPPGHASVCLWFTLLVYELFMNCLCCFWIVFRKTEYLHYMPSISPYNPDLEVFHISHRARFNTSRTNRDPPFRPIPRERQMVVNFTGVDAAMASLGTKGIETKGLDSGWIWVNYNDLTATSLESWLIRQIIPKWP